MVTVFIYNNDVQSALRTLKKEQQREGTFRHLKSKKYHKPNRQLKDERFSEIIRRKIKEKKEKAVKVQSENTRITVSPFIFNSNGYVVRVFDNGQVVCFSKKGKKLHASMVDKFDFDNIENVLNDIKLAQQ